MVLSVLALVVVLALGSVAGYLAFLNHTASTNIQHQALLPTPSDGASGVARDPRASDAQNYLIIGSDAGPDRSGSRSDVIILVHVPADRKKVYLIHFPRDLYVSVPGHGKDKINAAFAYGGAPLLVRTLQNLVDVPIDHVAVMGFEGFKKMTDAVGGVDVNAEEPSNEGGVVIHKGMNHLGGADALAFVRERHQLSQGDISRGRRQMEFIKALMVRSLSKGTLANPVAFANLVDAATQNLTVDNGFTMSKIRSEALSLRGIRGKDIVFLTAPYTGYGTTSAGASIVVMDDPRLQDLSQDLRGDHMEDYVKNDSQ